MEQTYTISNLAAYNLKNTEIIGKQDPYVVFEAGHQRFQSKDCKKGGTSPVWQDVVHVKVPSGTSVVKVYVYNDNTLRPDSLIGSSEVHLPIRGGRLNLVDKKGNPSGELSFDVSSSGDRGEGMHRTGQIGTGIGNDGAAVGAGSGIGDHHTPGAGAAAGGAGALGAGTAAAAGHHRHHQTPGTGVGGNYDNAGQPGMGHHHGSSVTGSGMGRDVGHTAGGAPGSAVGGGYENVPQTGMGHHHHGPGTVGHGSTVPGTIAGRDTTGDYGEGRHHHGTGGGIGQAGSAGTGMGGGYHHESHKSHKDNSETFHETYGPGGEPTMTQRAKHAADEGMDSIKDHVPGMHGHHTSAPGTGPNTRGY